MPKTKKLSVVCSFCKEKVEIELPINIVEEKEFFPFEYLNIHGNPEHALMLFIDKNLVVRDTMVYEDINVAKMKGKEFSALVRMSETEALYSIYSEPLRLKILNLLTDGPMTEDQLIESLSSEKDFTVGAFNTLILPFIKTGLLTSSWLYETSFDCYFLLKDFIVYRIPSEITQNVLIHDLKYKKVRNLFFKTLNEFFNEYHKQIILDKNKRNTDIKFCLKVITERKYERIMYNLRNGPLSKEILLNSSESDLSHINELIQNKIILGFKVKNEDYYSLLCDIKINQFTPKYILNNITQKLKDKKISLEMATKHLDLLNESEIKT